jgi:WD40 repeat protein
LWDPDTGRQIGEPLTGHHSKITSVTFSPDGEMLASGSFNGTIRLWNPHTNQQIGESITSPSWSVDSVTFSPDGRFLASGHDNAIRLRDPYTGQQIGEPFTDQSGVYSVVFSPDGRLLASGGFDKTIRLWDTDVESWLVRACERVGRNLTYQEWQTYLPGEEYRKTCPQWPVGE